MTVVQKQDVIIVGAGAAGLGVGLALQIAGIEDFIILDRHEVGASFARWPAETRFITPSFPTNSVGMLDINAIALGVSPGFNMQTEHPTGEDFAAHLQALAAHFELPLREHTDVLSIQKVDDYFEVKTSAGLLSARHVIWAAGEYQYPRRGGFAGSDLCRHTSTIASYEDLEGDDFIIIGGYESGIDAAYHLAYHNKSARVLDKACPWKIQSSDPSVALSPFSFERMREFWFSERVELIPNQTIESVTRDDGGVYHVTLADGQVLSSPTQPLLAYGFQGSHHLVADLFASRDDGFPLLNEHDESTLVPGLFLCGPSVRHDNHIFCFIYKFRQRFPVVAKAIARSLNLPAEALEVYRQWGMYLDDLSCCGEECVSC